MDFEKIAYMQSVGLQKKKIEDADKNTASIHTNRLSKNGPNLSNQDSQAHIIGQQNAPNQGEYEYGDEYYDEEEDT